MARPDLAALVAGVDVFLPNAPEAERLGALGVRRAARRARVVKDGDKGAWAEVRGATASAPADPVRVVDTIGAGDAFNAGFLAGWLDGRGTAECLALGNRCGGVAVARIGGAQGLPDLRGILAPAPSPTGG
jgi:sugar/nucleoside kinase (ribokinase family)